MKCKSTNRYPNLIWRTGWRLLFLSLLIGVVVYLLASHISVIKAYDENDNLLFLKQVNIETTIESNYIHSVARCPMIEKFEVSAKDEIVLMESWNCSFGAGIEAETPVGATTRMENGYFIYGDINEPYKKLSLHAAQINQQTLTIDDETWDFSQKPFLDETINLYITKERRIVYWWHKLQLRW